MIRCVGKKRSAIIPTKKGDTIAAIAVVPYARPTCVPSNLRVVPRYVPIVTYQEPQTKYWRNIIIESRMRALMAALLRECSGTPRDHHDPEVRCDPRLPLHSSA